MFGAKDLWNSCKSYGHVVDAYIPARRSKAGKRFGFVRFIKVPDVDRLVTNLCTVWVGRYMLHPNVARFQRAPVNKYNDKINVNGSSSFKVGSKTSGDRVKGTNNSYAYVVKGDKVLKDVVDDTPMMVLDEACLNTDDYSLGLFGKVKEFASLTSLKVILAKEGYTNIDLKSYKLIMSLILRKELYGWKVPCKWWSRNTFNRIATRWGRLLNGEELEEGFYHGNRICISTQMNKVVFESFKMVYCGNVFWVRAIEVPGWVPDFEEECEEDANDESVDGDVQRGQSGIIHEEGDGSDSEVILETCFDNELGDGKLSPGQKCTMYDDPFGIYEILKKKREVCKNNTNQDDSIKYPPGFTPVVGVESGEGIEGEIKENSNSCDLNGKEYGENQLVERNVYSDDAQASNCSGHFKKSGAPRT
uniref:Nucleotide-binding alpha-beta plait domain-containing protein n=1 Tax=Tanacetum cinerariifolium TaxID=118510 RepID=A0A699IKS7_TANCI|nr:nucleotide-binding alpha-beta plait domain-containing protein [Tanacetum cinerariifolium]